MNKAVWLALGLMVPMVTAAPWYDTFNTETEGDPPANPEYTHTVRGTGTSAVQSDLWKIVSTGGTGIVGGGRLEFTNPAQYTNVSFEIQQVVNVDACSVRLYDEDWDGSGNFPDNADNLGRMISSGGSWLVQAGTNSLDSGVSTSAAPVMVTMSLDWGAQTVVFNLDGSDFGPLSFATTASLTLNGILVACNGEGRSLEFDNLALDGAAIPLVEPNPMAPDGLSALVTDGKTSDLDDGTVDLRWPVSADDPDQEQGGFRYDIYTNGFFIGSDTTTGADGEGVRYNQVVFTGGGIPTDTVFTIRAVNLTSGLESAASCSVTVDPSLLGDSGACGAAFPGSGGAISGVTFTTPTDTAAGLAGFCSDLMGDSAASLFLCGLILAITTFLGLGGAFAAMAGAPGLPAVIAGALGAFGVMLFNVQAQIWSLGAAAILILLATGVALGLTRRLFMGRVSGGD